MAKTRQEPGTRVVLALIFTVPLFFGGLTLWLWLVPLWLVPLRPTSSRAPAPRSCWRCRRRS